MKKADFTPIKNRILAANHISIGRSGDTVFLLVDGLKGFAASIPSDVFNIYYAEQGKIPALKQDGASFYAKRVRDYTKRSRYSTRLEWEAARLETLFTVDIMRKMKEAA